VGALFGREVHRATRAAWALTLRPIAVAVVTVVTVVSIVLALSLILALVAALVAPIAVVLALRAVATIFASFPAILVALVAPLIATIVLALRPVATIVLPAILAFAARVGALIGLLAVGVGRRGFLALTLAGGAWPLALAALLSARGRLSRRLLSPLRPTARILTFLRCARLRCAWLIALAILRSCQHGPRQ